MGGMHGSYASNIYLTDADFMIAIGCRFDDRLTGNPKHLLRMQRLFILMWIRLRLARLLR